MLTNVRDFGDRLYSGDKSQQRLEEKKKTCETKQVTKKKKKKNTRNIKEQHRTQLDMSQGHLLRLGGNKKASFSLMVEFC